MSTLREDNTSLARPTQWIIELTRWSITALSPSKSQTHKAPRVFLSSSDALSWAWTAFQLFLCACSNFMAHIWFLIFDKWLSGKSFWPGYSTSQNSTRKITSSRRWPCSLHKQNSKCHLTPLDGSFKLKSQKDIVDQTTGKFGLGSNIVNLSKCKLTDSETSLLSRDQNS